MVGVLGDVYSRAVVEEPAIVVYYPVVLPDVERWYPTAMRLVVRTTRGEPALPRRVLLES